MKKDKRTAGESMNLQLRRGRPGDAGVLGSICHDAFRTISARHSFPPDFPEPAPAIELMATMLASPHVYSVVAELDDRIVGSNFLWETAAIAGLGPITISPEAQNAQVGRRLMLDVLARAEQQRFAGVRLVQAGYHGRSLSLYTKLGFETREPLATMQGPALGAAIPGFDVRPAREADLPACNGLCRRVHGFDRSGDLAPAIAQRTATVVERGGRIAGYATLIGFFGHAVAETNEDLEALIAGATAFAGPGFLLPIRNAGLFRWCLEHGLKVVQPMNLMSLGLYSRPAGAFLPSILY